MLNATLANKNGKGPNAFPKRRKSDAPKTTLVENDSSPHQSKGDRKERSMIKEDPDGRSSKSENGPEKGVGGCDV